MADQDKLSDLNDKKSIFEARRAHLDKITSEFSSQISSLQNQQKELKSDRTAAETQYQEALKQPHEKLDQLLAAQDEKARIDADLEKVDKALPGPTTGLREAVGEQAQVDRTIQGLNEKIERTEKIEEFKEAAAPYVDGAKAGVKMGIVGGVSAVLLSELEHHGVSPELVTEAVESAKLHWEGVVQPQVEMAAQSVNAAAEKFAADDAAKLDHDKAFHAEQIVAVNTFKSEIGSQIDASTAEMQKVMGKDFSLAGQKEFCQNEFNSAFQKANDFVANQVQEREQFFASNTSVLSPVAQQQNQAGMNQELQQAHYGLTRGLAVKQAEVNVDLANQEMRQLEQKRLEGQGVSKDQLKTEMKPLDGILDQQKANDVYMEANKIHTQQCPEMSMNPPAIAPQQQQGPPQPGM